MKKISIAAFAIMALLAFQVPVVAGVRGGSESRDPAPRSSQAGFQAAEMTGSWTRKITETKDWYDWTFYLTFFYMDGRDFAQKGNGVLNISTGGKDYKVTLDYSSSGVYAVDGDNLTVNLDPSKTMISATQEGLPEFVCGILAKVEKHYRKSLAKPIKFKIVSVGETQIVLINGNKERAVFDRDK